MRPPSKSKKRIMVEKTINFINELIKSQGVALAVLIGILLWNQYNYIRLEEKMEICNNSVIRMYAEDRTELINILTKSTETLQAAQKKIKCGE